MSWETILIDGDALAEVEAASSVDLTGDLSVLGSVSIGADPATSGDLRLENNAWIAARNAADSGNVNMWKVNTGNWLEHSTRIYYDNSADGYVDRGAVHHIRRDVGTPASVVPTLSILTKSYGDNTTFIGSSGISITMADPSDVASGTKGVLYGVAISIQPGIHRNNVPFDDTAGVVVQNDGTGKGTDAYYLGEGGNVAGGQKEWITGYLSNSPVNYAFRVTNSVDNGLKLDEATISGPAIIMANGQYQQFGGVGANPSYIQMGTDRLFKFVKPTGDTASSLNALFHFSTLGGLDSINPFWNGMLLGGHSVTDGGSPVYPALAIFARSATGTNPTDYEFMFAGANAGNRPLGVSFAGNDKTNSFIRFGFGDGTISLEGMRLKYDGTHALLGVGTNSPTAVLHAAGTITNPAAAAVILSPTMNIGSTGRATISSQAQIVPTASIAEVYGMLFIPTLVGTEGVTTNTITSQITGITARIDTLANYDANINFAAPFKALHPYEHQGGGTIARYAGIHLDVGASQARVTELWNIYADGAAPSYFAGKIGVGVSPVGYSYSPKMVVYRAQDGSEVVETTLAAVTLIQANGATDTSYHHSLHGEIGFPSNATGTYTGATARAGLFTAYHDHASLTFGTLVGFELGIAAYRSGGTLTNGVGLTLSASVASGATITDRRGIHISDTSGAGSLGTQIGLYIADLAKATTNNWAIYVDGDTPSYFGGNIQTIKGLNVDSGTDASTNLYLRSPADTSLKKAFRMNGNTMQIVNSGYTLALMELDNSGNAQFAGNVTALGAVLGNQVAFLLGKSGTIPAATTNDTADFIVVVPFNMTLKRLKTTVATKPSSDTTVQIRRSTDGGASFSNAFGTVSITAAGTGKVHTADPADLNVDEGDVLNFSITGGGGTGTNLTVEVIGTTR